MGTAPSDSTDDEGHLVLKGELFWKWKAMATAVAHCDAEIKARTPLIDKMLDELPELKKLLGERSAYVQQRMTMAAEYKAVLAELEAHFGFSMQNVSIDDLTGRVHRLEEATHTPLPPDKTNGVNGHATNTPKKSSTVAPKQSKKPTTKKRK